MVDCSFLLFELITVTVNYMHILFVCPVIFLEKILRTGFVRSQLHIGKVLDPCCQVLTPSELCHQNV